MDEANNGYEAYMNVTSKGRNYYDVIILALCMPIMDGIETSNKIQDFLYKAKVQ